jgi:DNA adenine methylase Dam
MNYINTPFSYTGSKFKLLEQILPEFDYTKSTFIDLFCGGGSVYTNIVEKYDNIIVNDIIEDLIDIHINLINNMNDFIETIKKISPHKDNQKAFIELRKSYNENKTSAKLFALMLSSTNNMMRFNKKFQYNQTFGKRTFNERTEKKIYDFVNHILPYKEKIQFISSNFINIDINNNCMVYIDPPYSNTEAGYNSYWNIEDEKKLYEYIIKLHKNKNSFILSGVLIHNNKESELLKKLISDGFRYKELECNYNKVSRLNKNKHTKEIIIKNY